MNVNVHFTSEATFLTAQPAPPNIATHPGGRVRDPAKDAAIVAAARACFFERGFAGTTMEEIAQRAGVSKVTVYSRFPDKQSLFEAFCTSQMASMAASFDDDDIRDAPLELRLNTFGVALISFLFDPAHVSFKRTMMILLRDMPDFAQRFFDAGPGQCRTLVAAVLDEACRAGTIACDDPVSAAEDLISLWKGFDDVEMEFGLIDGLDDARVRAKVERGTAHFLRMVAV
jgi:TetR/AcrR family transcriptional regulator, mexJK operon transcriptional repressor